MPNIQNYMKKCTNTSTDNNLQLIVNGQFKEITDKEDMEFMRFMIGGIGSK